MDFHNQTLTHPHLEALIWTPQHFYCVTFTKSQSRVRPSQSTDSNHRKFIDARPIIHRMSPFPQPYCLGELQPTLTSFIQVSICSHPLACRSFSECVSGRYSVIPHFKIAVLPLMVANLFN